MNVAGIGPLLTQAPVLLSDEVNHQRWVLMDQGQKAGAIQTDQGQGGQSPGIAAVALIRRDQILVEEQFPWAITDTWARSVVQLHQTLFDHMDGIDSVATTEHQGTRGKRPPVTFPMGTDQSQRRCIAAARAQALEVLTRSNYPPISAVG